MDEDEPPFRLELFRVCIRVVVVVAVHDHLAAQGTHGVYLDRRRGHGHHDDGRDSAALRGQCHTLGVVARGTADDAGREGVVGHRGELVVGTAQLEREHGLQVFALEPDPVACPRREVRRELERRPVRHVVDGGVADFL
jgi:hypothetical protein